MFNFKQNRNIEIPDLDEDICFNFDPFIYISPKEMFFNCIDDDDITFHDTNQNLIIPEDYEPENIQENTDYNLVVPYNPNNSYNFNFGKALPEFLTGAKYMKKFAQIIAQSNLEYLKKVIKIINQSSQNPNSYSKNKVQLLQLK